MLLPPDDKRLTAWSLEIVDRCLASSGRRADMARNIHMWRHTGSPDGQPAILNRLDQHILRVSSFLFSPIGLRFSLDFEDTYPEEILDKASVAANVLTRAFAKTGVDMMYSQGVNLALEFGCAIPKALWTNRGPVASMVMPWQFGVYREDKIGLEAQEVVVERNYITIHEFWRRISHLPGAVELLRRARAHATNRNPTSELDSSIHQIVLAGTSPVVQTQAPYTNQTAGFAMLTQPNPAMMSPQVADELIEFWEIWAIDDDRQDYTTIQIAAPDILIAPRQGRRRFNYFVPGHLPYGLIQPNPSVGNFWGRTELANLLMLQLMLRDRMEDMKRLMKLQYDRLLGFTGQTGVTDDLYDQFKHRGWINLGPGDDIKDLTPEMPKEAFAEIEQIMKFMDEVSGFQNVLAGQGEPGVRAGEHAKMLMRTASPHLRERAVIVERQCATFGSTIYELKAAKEAKAYRTRKGAEFLLGQLPDDRYVTVDSHSSSPVYEEDHQQSAAFLAKAGAIGGDDLIEMMPVPRKPQLVEKYHKRQEQKAMMAMLNPELADGKKKSA